MIEVKGEYEELKEHFVVPDGGVLRPHDMYHLFLTFESLRQVARAANRLREYPEYSYLGEALDPLPAWVLDDEEELASG